VNAELERGKVFLRSYGSGFCAEGKSDNNKKGTTHEVAPFPILVGTGGFEPPARIFVPNPCRLEMW
jgi:hypothetical protein